jgi:hypothetical protein
VQKTFVSLTIHDTTHCHNTEDRNLNTAYFLTEMPALSQNEDVDISWYNCSSLPFAAAARLAHKQQLHSLNSPWWHKLKL